MNKPLDELYFVWLYSQVGDSEIKNPARTYWQLLRQLFTKEFVWTVPNDDNRIEDGKDLRYEFVDELELADVDIHWVQMGCSMFELLVGLSRRLSFETEDESKDWFWHLISNLGLLSCTDEVKCRKDQVEEVLDRVIWRTYEPNGRGGLFPLKHTNKDQRYVELWYQLSEYVLELK